jgi:hypothetical protein
MSTYYAVDIFTGTSVTDVTRGIVGGVFRFISDAVTYTAGMAHYGPNEISILGGNISGMATVATFYAGFLVKENNGISTNASRSIDLTYGGSYSNDSGFGFTIGNNSFQKFLDDNSINLIGKISTFWVMIDDIFYQQGRGRITSTSCNETTYSISVGDEANFLHKQLPPSIVNSVTSPTAPADSQASPVPIVFGDVKYSKLLKRQQTETYQDLACNVGRNFKVTAGIKYFGTGVNNINYDGAIESEYTTLYLLFTAYLRSGETGWLGKDQLKGKYLKVIKGKDAKTSQIYRIIGNEATTDFDLVLYPFCYTTIVYLATPLLHDDDTYVAASEFDYGVTTSYAYFMGTPYTEAGYCSGVDTWWFSVVDFSLPVQVSQGIVQTSGMYSWNDQLNEYEDISAQISNLADSTNLHYLSNIVTGDGSLQVYRHVSSTDNSGNIAPLYLKEFGLCDVDYTSVIAYQRTPLNEDIFQILTDKNKTDDSTFEIGYTIPDNHNYFIYGIYDLDRSCEGVGDNYFLADFSAKGDVTNVKVGRFVNQVYDILAYQNRRNDYGSITTHWSDDSTYTGHIAFPIIPNEYYPTDGRAVYDDSTSFSLSMFDYQAVPPYSYRNLYHLANTDYLTDPGMREVTYRFGFYATGVGAGGYRIHIRELALISEESVNTLSGDIYTQVTGELSHGVLTNNVYSALQHILEDYDGIPSGLIDYGTTSEQSVAINRGEWHCGRTLYDQKNSIDYLSELCQQSYVGMFPSRQGKLALRVLDPSNTGTPTVYHDETRILRDSIASFEKTSLDNVFNNFSILYNWSEGAQKYTMTMTVSGIDSTTGFPTAGVLDSTTGLPAWYSLFGGIDSWSDASEVWTYCRNSYIKNGIVRKATDDLSQLPWYVGTIPNDNENSSAFKFLKVMSQWTTVQKDIVKYDLPIDKTTAQMDLMDIVYFRDPVFTDNTAKIGWITGLEVDPGVDRVHVTTMLLP